MRYAVALRKNTYSLVKDMISFDQAGGERGVEEGCCIQWRSPSVRGPLVF
jgi:hypothetical protein